jgi:FMN hydrolase / 5-amino-6-(5-phospho-D-ribitylamino)uracil phosphatase
VHILAVSLDLDDTLWPVLPALVAAEQCIDDWLREHHPSVADAWPIEAMRVLREKIAADRLDLSHDFSAQRRLTFKHAFAACGIDDAPVDEAWEIYFAARNRVELYPDTLAALERIVARVPVVSISNGNADLERIGIERFFRGRINASGVGVAKPDKKIFLAASQLLDIPAENILHVGDDPLLDVIGARDAGMRTAWLNRDGLVWMHEPAPDLEFADMTALADWLDGKGGITTT